MWKRIRHDLCVYAVYDAMSWNGKQRKKNETIQNVSETLLPSIHRMKWKKKQLTLTIYGDRYMKWNEF